MGAAWSEGCAVIYLVPLLGAALAEMWSCQLQVAKHVSIVLMMTCVSVMQICTEQLATKDPACGRTVSLGI